MRYKIYRNILIILFVITPGMMFGQYFRYFTNQEGLSNNAVYSIVQDSEGLMWFGTINGLHCFNGQHIKAFSSTSEVEGLGDVIFSIIEDHNKCLWLGTDAGVVIYDLVKGNYKSLNELVSNKVKINSRVRDVFMDSQSNIWISTMGQGLFLYDAKELKLKQIHLPSISLHENVKDVMEDKLGNIWITTITNGLICYNPNQQTQKKYSGNKSLKGWTSFEDSHANIWFGTDDGLYLVDKKKNCLVQKMPPLVKKGILEIKSIVELNNGELLLATDEGLIRYRVNTADYVVIKNNLPQHTGLNDNYLHALYIDKERGLWIGTYFGGVDYLSPTSFNFSLYDDINLSISGKVISVFEKDKKENLWIGTDDAGVFFWNKKDQKVKVYTPTYQNIHALMLTDNKLYIGMYMGGLDVLDIKTGKIKNYTNNELEHSLSSSCVYAVYKDIYGVLWVGTQMGLNKYNPNNDSFERIRVLSKVDVVYIIEDSKGYLWVATQGNGVYRLDRKTNRWKNYNHQIGDENSLLSKKINTMCIDDKQQLWFGTNEKGICKFNYKKESFEHHFLEKAPSKIVYKIIPDNNSLWITTSNGLLNYQPTTKKMKLYDSYDGLYSNQFSPNTGIRMNDGTILLGGIEGLNAFKPSDMIQNTLPPKVIFTDFQVFNKPLQLNKSIVYTKHITLKQRQSVFSIKFAALSYTNTQKNKYLYKLDGFDNDWTEILGNPNVIYTNLPAGDFVFKVKASNGDGVWNKEEKTLAITIEPYWWWWWPLKIIYLILLMGLFYFFYYNIRKGHRKKMAYLEVKKDKEIYQVKIDFFTNIIHEIRTPLTLILGPLNNVMKSRGTLKDTIPQLQVIEKNGKRLLALVNQLMDFRKIEEGGIKINLKTTNINSLLEEIYKSFKLSAELKKINTHLFMPKEICYASVDIEAFTKIISNLLGNALKFTTTLIDVSLYNNDQTGEIEICIKDNGEGVEEKNQQKIFEAFYQISENCPNDNIGTGLGLPLVRKLVELLKGKVRLVSQVGVGSDFIINLPSVNSSEAQLVVEYESIKSLPEITFDLKDKYSLLIVDDNSDMLTYLRGLFSRNYNVLCASDGEEGLAVIEKRLIDLVISDIMMPKINGIEFCLHIKQDINTSHIPVLLLTAKVNKEDKIEGLESGADIYVEKPFSAEVLIAQVNGLLKNRERLRVNLMNKPMTPISSVAYSKKDDEFLEKMKLLIETNLLNSNFSVEELAKELGMGRSAFFIKVKGISGTTPNNFIRLIRLKKAAERFSNGENSVSEVCFEVGFSSPSYFSKCFQNQFGQSPTEYIKERTLDKS